MSDDLNNSSSISTDEFDYSFVSTPARIACYDDLSTAPRITVIEPDRTAEFIESLTTTIYNQSHTAGGTIPYTIIREVSENFIHARFTEIIVSILDNGNTIRFADQGPGIVQKEKAKLPGFSSAIEPMKAYIRGVGSGFPIVKDYFDSKNGTITIEDNLQTGAVVTISLVQKNIPVITQHETHIPTTSLSEREKTLILALHREGSLGITEIHNLTGIPNATISVTLNKLEQQQFVEYTSGKKRGLTAIGEKVARQLL